MSIFMLIGRYRNTNRLITQLVGTFLCFQMKRLWFKFSLPQLSSYKKKKKKYYDYNYLSLNIC